MDKLKLLNLFILAFLLSLGVQYFFLPEKNTVNTAQWAILSIKGDSITIPNIPTIELQNLSTGALVINPCSDMTMTIDSVPLVGMSESVPSFCQPLTVTSGSSAVLPLKELYQVFATKSGKYSATIKTPFGDRSVFFTMSEPGFFRTLLSTFVYQPIYNLFVALLTFLPGHSLGWAIIIVTFIIRLILLVPQNHMLEGQKKLQKLQPKIKALQKEYKGDQATLGMKMLELYKTEWVNPMGSILPLFIQMPILIGLYWVISQINDPSNFYHLYSFFKDFRPTEISTLFYGVDLADIGGIIGLVFAILLWVLQFIQAKLSFAYTTKKAPTNEEAKKEEWVPEIALDPVVMQNMMLYFFPFIIAITSYFFPLGVGLYWFIGTLFLIVQQAYVNKKK